jgi:IS5 family transposase
MKSFAARAFRKSYRKQKSQNRLLHIPDLIDWSPIRSILDEYDNKSEKGGRPNFDVILMFKVSDT